MQNFKKTGSILFAMYDVLKGIRRFIALLVMLIGKTCWNSLWKFQMIWNGKTIISHVYFTNIGTFTLPDSENGYKRQWDSVLVSLSGQYEHLHTILQKPFLSVSVLVSVSGTVNTPLHLYTKNTNKWPVKRSASHKISEFTQDLMGYVKHIPHAR